MGGAGAYAIEAVDLFLIALLFFQWRDARQGGPRMARTSALISWSGTGSMKAMYPGVIQRILTTPIRGLEGFQEMMKKLYDASALKVYVEVAEG